jgi:hypothetical protein
MVDTSNYSDDNIEINGTIMRSNTHYSLFDRFRKLSVKKSEKGTSKIGSSVT